MSTTTINIVPPSEIRNLVVPVPDHPGCFAPINLGKRLMAGLATLTSRAATPSLTIHEKQEIPTGHGSADINIHFTLVPGFFSNRTCIVDGWVGFHWTGGGALEHDGQETPWTDSVTVTVNGSNGEVTEFRVVGTGEIFESGSRIAAGSDWDPSSKVVIDTVKAAILSAIARKAYAAAL